MTTTDFSSAPESFDSRDAIERLTDLEASDVDGQEGLDEDEREELEALRELAECGVEDWQYGASFIREDQFEDYAREFAADIGALDDNAAWPASCIDWEQAAKELAQDYTSITFQGHDYYVR